MSAEKKMLLEMAEQILREAGKFYSHDEDHNPRLPADYWFQYPTEGLTLFLVMYTRSCRWSRCTGCSLPSKMSNFEVPFSDIIRQTDFIFDYFLSSKQKGELRKIILSNNGSVLDEETYSTTALLYFVAKMNLSCANIDVLTLETRPEYVDMAELEVLHRALREGTAPTALELAVGFEAFDEVIRNEHFQKGLTLEVFEAMVKKIARYQFRLKTYFMLKPTPGLSEEDAIADIVGGIHYLDRLARRYRIPINMHLNPTYVAAGALLEKEFHAGRFTPPLLDSVRRAALAAEGKNISLYIGLNDEGLAVENGSFRRPGDEALIERLHRFNISQDYALLK